jgi:hypothetical protein
MRKIVTVAACLFVACSAHAMKTAPGSDASRGVTAPANPVVITRGLLNSVDPEARKFVMNGATYALDPETRVLREEKGGRLTPIKPADLRAGRQVTVRMQTVRDGVRVVEIVQ